MQHSWLVGEQRGAAGGGLWGRQEACEQAGEGWARPTICRPSPTGKSSKEPAVRLMSEIKRGWSEQSGWTLHVQNNRQGY